MTEYKYQMLANILENTNKDISHKLYLDEIRKINKEVFDDNLLYEFSEKGCFKFKCIINLMLALSGIKAGNITSPDTNAELEQMLSENGINLMAGETVTTGTCTIPIAVQKGDIVKADFGILGAIQLSLC